MTSLPNCVNLEGSAEGGRARGTVSMGMVLQYTYRTDASIRALGLCHDLDDIL